MNDGYTEFQRIMAEMKRKIEFEESKKKGVNPFGDMFGNIFGGFNV